MSALKSIAMFFVAMQLSAMVISQVEIIPGHPLGTGGVSWANALGVDFPEKVSTALDLLITSLNEFQSEIDPSSMGSIDYFAAVKWLFLIIFYATACIGGLAIILLFIILNVTILAPIFYSSFFGIIAPTIGAVFGAAVGLIQLFAISWCFTELIPTNKQEL